MRTLSISRRVDISLSQTISENADCGWFDMFDDSELEEPVCEPTDEQIEELKDYLNENYNYLPE